MENKFQTSFIPKSFDESGRVKIKTPHNLLSIISTIIIFSMIAASAGFFIYGKILEKKVAAAEQVASAKEASLDYSAVDKIVIVDRQIKTADSLLKNHTALSKLFNVLEENTIKNLRFTSFQFSYISPTQIALVMKGNARSFGAVSKQAELLTSSESAKQYFKSPLFSDLNLDPKGNVGFTFLTTIDPALLTYNPQQ